MVVNIARYGFALVAVLACVGALVRVVTAPDRVRERRNTAQQVCASTGGTWARVDGDEKCVTLDAPKQN